MPTYHFARGDQFHKALGSSGLPGDAMRHAFKGAPDRIGGDVRNKFPTLKSSLLKRVTFPEALRNKGGRDEAARLLRGFRGLKRLSRADAAALVEFARG